IVDKALEKLAATGKPIRLGMIGAGFMGRGVALNIIQSTPGIELVCIANRHPDGAARAYQEAGVENFCAVDSVSELEEAIAAGRKAITANALAVCEAENVDVVLEVTGAIEFGAEVALKAIAHGKHIILMNAELDSTLGPLLKKKADQA